MRAMTRPACLALALLLSLAACSSSDSDGSAAAAASGGSGGSESAGAGGGGGSGESAGTGGSSTAGASGQGGAGGGAAGSAGSAGSGAGGKPLCTPGQQLACACPGSTTQGAQKCKDDGSGFTDCAGCPGSGGAGGGAGASGASGAGGGVCQPKNCAVGAMNFPACGVIDDGCGAQVDCKSCEVGPCGTAEAVDAQHCRCVPYPTDDQICSINTGNKLPMALRCAEVAPSSTTVPPLPGCMYGLSDAGWCCQKM